MSSALRFLTSALYGWRFVISVSLLLILLHNQRTHCNILSANHDNWGIYDVKNPLVPLSLEMQAELDWLSPQVPLPHTFTMLKKEVRACYFFNTHTQCQYTLKYCLISTFSTSTTTSLLSGLPDVIWVINESKLWFFAIYAIKIENFSWCIRVQQFTMNLLIITEKLDIWSDNLSTVYLIINLLQSHCMTFISRELFSFILHVSWAKQSISSLKHPGIMHIQLWKWGWMCSISLGFVLE